MERYCTDLAKTLNNELKIFLVMENADINDYLFLEAVEAIDEGNKDLLQSLILKHPRLITDPLDYPVEGYFKNPYLLWFVADNPIRIEKLPNNIRDITAMLIRHVKQNAKNAELQLNYTLGLVATGRIPKECGVQIELMDLLIEEGAKTGGALGALANGNTEAALFLLERGEKINLPIATGLNLLHHVEKLFPTSNNDERVTALTVAAFFGNSTISKFLLDNGTNPNGYPQRESGFHSHATPLHQAVYSGSLAVVKLLVEGGADLEAKDKIFEATVPGWVEYFLSEESLDKSSRDKYEEIALYLKEIQTR